MNKAIFLDRDGVINRERGEYTYRIGDFEILSGLIDSLKRFREKGYLLIMITNQGGIARGIYTHADFEKVTNHLISELNKKGVELKDYFYSPHYDASGRSLSRKPDSLLIERAIAKYNIDKSKSYFIGDKERDIFAAEKAGVIPIKIESNQLLNEIEDKIL